MLVDISDIKELEVRLRLLSDAGETLTSSLEYPALLEKAARFVVPALADLCVLDLVSEAGAALREVVLFADAKRQATSAEHIKRYAPPSGRLSLPSRVIASGEPLLLERGLADLRGRFSYGDEGSDPLLDVDLRSLMVVPLRARGQTFGALKLAIVESDRHYTSLDLEVVQDLARRVAMALDNGRLYAESRRAAEELRVAEAKSSGIVSVSADAIISIDEDQRITLFNEGAEKIFGYSKAEAIGRPVELLIPDHLREAHRRHVERFAKGDEVARKMGGRIATIVGQRKNGEEFPADAAISKLAVGGRTIMTVSLRDVTNQKRIEREQIFLANVGSVLATTLRPEDTLAAVVDLALGRLADFCIIDVVEEDGQIRRLKASGRDASKQWVSDLLMQVELDRHHPYLLWSALEQQQALLVDTDLTELFASWSQGDEYLRALRGLDAR
jgi:PAS domain S-box-containing protein